jgi:hypothetical protein
MLLIDLLQWLEQALLRVPGRGLERWLLRGLGCVPFWALEQRPERALVQCNERRLEQVLFRVLVQGPVQGLLQ